MPVLVGKKLRTFNQGDDGHMQYLQFYCPGCKENHTLRRRIEGRTDGWTWNGSGDTPTFDPSIKVTGKEPITEEEYHRVMAGETIVKPGTVCHSYVREGVIQFLTDCTHALAGKTVPLPDYPDCQNDD